MCILLQFLPRIYAPKFILSSKFSLSSAVLDGIHDLHPYVNMRADSA